jgi:alkylation response protein AidB-like acyl-CoA dehydrogenase
MNPRCEIFIVMGKTDPSADRHRQQSQILVPRDTPGVEIHRGMRVFGYDDGWHGGHAEITFTDVRVPVGNLIAGAPILDLHASGFIGSILGALAVLFIMGWAGRRGTARSYV